MSAHTRKYITCDAPNCRAIFWGRVNLDGMKDVRRKAALDGWQHPSGYVDYCPDCR